MKGEQWMLCIDFSKAFDIVSHNILVMKLRKCGIDEWTVKWIENWLTGRAQRVVNSGTESGWRPVNSNVPLGQCWVWSCSTSSSVIWTKGWSVPLACLLIIQSWEELLTHRKVVLPLNETGTSWRAG